MASVFSETLSKISNFDLQSHLRTTTKTTDHDVPKEKVPIKTLEVPGKRLGKTTSRTTNYQQKTFLKVPGKTLVPTPSTRTLVRSPLHPLHPPSLLHPPSPNTSDGTAADLEPLQNAQTAIDKRAQRNKYCELSISVPNCCYCCCKVDEYDHKSTDNKSKTTKSVDSKGKSIKSVDSKGKATKNVDGKGKTIKMVGGKGISEDLLRSLGTTPKSVASTVTTQRKPDKKRKITLKKIKLRFRKPHIPTFLTRKDAPCFVWHDINAGVEPKVTKAIRKKARTIFRLLERLNVTREIGSKTFSVMFRSYPHTLAFMVSAMREMGPHEPTISALLVPKPGLCPKRSDSDGDPGTAVDADFNSLVFNAHEISYFTPMTLRHSFFHDIDLKQFTPILTHLGAVTAALMYIVTSMHDEIEVMMFIDELSRIHSRIPGIDAFYFRTMMESIDQGLLALIGKDIYTNEWRRSMIKLLEWIYYHMTRDMPDEFTTI